MRHTQDTLIQAVLGIELRTSSLQVYAVSIELFPW